MSVMESLIKSIIYLYFLSHNPLYQIYFHFVFKIFMTCLIYSIFCLFTLQLLPLHV